MQPTDKPKIVAKVGGLHFSALLAPEIIEHFLPSTWNGLPHLMVAKHDFQLPQFFVLCHFWSPGFVVITINIHISSFLSGDPSKNRGFQAVSYHVCHGIPGRRLEDWTVTCLPQWRRTLEFQQGQRAPALGGCPVGSSKVRISGF